jgi:hypothetical protein
MMPPPMMIISGICCLLGWLERVKGIEPSLEAWEASVLPLNYTRQLLLCFVTIPFTLGDHSGHPRSPPFGPVAKNAIVQFAPGKLVEPSLEAWEATVLPLNRARLF